MTKIALIIGAVLALAGAALAGTVTGLGSAGTPSIGSTLPTAAVPMTVQRGRSEPRHLREAKEHLRGERGHARGDDGLHHRGGQGHGGRGSDD